MNSIRLAVVGATGMVGRTVLQVLEERGTALSSLTLFASSRSQGTSFRYRGATLLTETLTEEALDPKRFDAAIFCAGGAVSAHFGRLAKARGILVIDNSSAFRMEAAVPLVVPEVNPEALKRHGNLVANPNCSTIQSVLPLAVLEDLFGLKRVAYTTYQAVSGSGNHGLEDLLRTQRGEAPAFYPKPIAGNCLPHIDVFLPDGSTKEERKMVEETRKILGLLDLPVTATCVRVPVVNGHCVAMNVTLSRPPDLQRLVEGLKAKEGITVFETDYPTPRDASGQDQVLVGRIRVDESQENSLHLWVVADNIRKGAATNAVQILETIIKEELL